MAVERWRPFGRTLERWGPFRDLEDIQSEVNRLFDSFFGRPLRSGLIDRTWSPVLDVYETQDELVVSAELPGTKEKDIHVSMTGDVLTIKGERSHGQETNKGSYQQLERFFGTFERNIPLSIPVQTEKVKAQYRDGVLEIRLPKVEEVKPKQIKIEVK